MEFRAQKHHEALGFVRINPYNCLVLCVIQEFGEFLEAEVVPVEMRRFIPNPLPQIVRP